MWPLTVIRAINRAWPACAAVVLLAIGPSPARGAESLPETVERIDRELAGVKEALQALNGQNKGGGKIASPRPEEYFFEVNPLMKTPASLSKCVVTMRDFRAGDFRSSESNQVFRVKADAGATIEVNFTATVACRQAVTSELQKCSGGGVAAPSSRHYLIVFEGDTEYCRGQLTARPSGASAQ